MLPTGRVAGHFACGKVPDWFPDCAPWFSIQGDADADSLPLYLMTGVEFGQPSNLENAACGSLLLDRVSDAHIRATVMIDGNGKDQFSPAPSPRVQVFELHRAVPA